MKRLFNKSFALKETLSSIDIWRIEASSDTWPTDNCEKYIFDAILGCTNEKLYSSFSNGANFLILKLNHSVTISSSYLWTLS